MSKREFDSYTFGEVKTAGGQTVSFTCSLDDRVKIAAFLSEYVRDIDIPTTGKVNVSHGGYGRYTRYDVTQHQYAGYSHEDGGGGGYIEVLEVKNPPDGRSGFIIHDFRSVEGAVFTEWATLADAFAAYKQFWKMPERQHRTWQELKCKRFVACGALSPWFYAVGDQELIGDYAFPEGLQDDPVYATGCRFVVCTSAEDMPRIKTCLGTRFFSGNSRDSSHHQKPWYRRMVHWDDGSVTLFESDNNSPNSGWVRPLEDGELWVTEALEQFRRLLTGKADRFSIKFSDGTQFVGRVIPAKVSAELTRPGEYYARLRIVGGKEREGKFDFVPTAELPDVAVFLRNRFAPEQIELLEVRPNLPKGKKWTGVFYGRTKS